jgi:hypothetical protein
MITSVSKKTLPYVFFYWEKKYVYLRVFKIVFQSNFYLEMY